MATDSNTWESRIDAWRASGLSARAFAQGKGYAAGSLYYWRRRLERALASEGPRLARVVRVRGGPPAASDAPRGASIVVEIGGARVLVPPDFDRQSLVALVDLLGERARGDLR